MTALAPFTPKGDQPEWRLVYDQLAGRNLPPDTLITFDQLDGWLGRDFRSNRSPLYRARIELELTDRRTLTAVPNVGYRVPAAREHEDVGKHHRRRSRRAMNRAVQVLRAADRALLKPDEAVRIDRLEMQVSALARVIAYDHARIDRHERALRKAGLLSDDDQHSNPSQQLPRGPLRRHEAPGGVVERELSDRAATAPTPPGPAPPGPAPPGPAPPGPGIGPAPP